jgi:hypothetical protein
MSIKRRDLGRGAGTEGRDVAVGTAKGGYKITNGIAPGD